MGGDDTRRVTKVRYDGSRVTVAYQRDREGGAEGETPCVRGSP